MRARPALAVHRLGFEVLAYGEQLLGALGIDGRDYLVLAILGTDEPESQRELAELAWKAPQVIGTMVDSLERRELVTRRPAIDADQSWRSPLPDGNSSTRRTQRWRP